MQLTSKHKRIIEIIAVMVIIIAVSLVGTYTLSNYTITPDQSLPREWIPEQGTVFVGYDLSVYQVYAYRIKGQPINKTDERRVLKVGYLNREKEKVAEKVAVDKKVKEKAKK